MIPNNNNPLRSDPVWSWTIDNKSHFIFLKAFVCWFNPHEFIAAMNERKWGLGDEGWWTSFLLILLPAVGGRGFYILSCRSRGVCDGLEEGNKFADFLSAVWSNPSDEKLSATIIQCVWIVRLSNCMTKYSANSWRLGLPQIRAPWENGSGYTRSGFDQKVRSV